MSDSIKIEPAGVAQRDLLRNLLQLYLYDFLEFVAVERNTDGLFIYPYLDHYWTEPDRFPFLISVEGEHIGFALIREELDPLTNEITHDLAEFFVMRKFRRKDIGTQAAHLLVNKLPGRWLLRVLANNNPALRFWQHALKKFNPSYTMLQPSADYEFRFSNSRTEN